MPAHGAANHAFSLGVPIVVAGDSEDKDYVAARVGWTGAGINLKTRYATAEQVRDAARTILTDKRYRHEAQRLRTNFSRYDALAEIARTVDAMLPEGKSRMTPRPVTKFLLRGTPASTPASERNSGQSYDRSS